MTSTTRSPIVWLALVVAVFLSACSPPPEQQAIKGMVEHNILPAYRQFATASSELYSQTQAFCDAPNAENYRATQEAWRQAVLGWSAIQFLQFGPLMIDNQAWKIQFWPDKKNLIARKTEALLASDDSLDIARVDRASVVVQGLSAMEYLLFDKAGGQHMRYNSDSPRPCQALVAIAGHLQQVASRLNHAWQPELNNYAAKLLSPGADNDEYPNREQVLVTLLDSLVYGVELIKRDKLERPLAIPGEGGFPQPYVLEWWRSQYSKEAIIANLQHLRTLYTAGQTFGIDDLIAHEQYADPPHQALAAAITNQFDAALNKLAAFDTSLFSAPSDPELKQALLDIHSDITALVHLLEDELPKAMGLSLSFNANDGD